jgi:hypothetical protein
MKIIFNYLLITVLLLGNIRIHHAQGFECYNDDIIPEYPQPPTQPPQSSNCTPSGEYQDESGIIPYIPNDNSQIYYVRVNLHSMLKSDGTENFKSNDLAHRAYLNGLIEELNNIYYDNVEPLYGGPTGDPYIEDSKIRFLLQNIYYHEDDLGWNNNGDVFDHYCFNKYILMQKSSIKFFKWVRLGFVVS